MAAKRAEQVSSPVDISVATRPNNIEAVPSLLRDIIEDVNSLKTGTDEDRKGILVKCRTLIRALETPRETMVNHCWGQVSA